MKRSHENSSERILTPFFYILPYFFSFLGLAMCELDLQNYCVYIIYFIFHSLLSFNGISVGF